jgi:hypothetical protein
MQQLHLPSHDAVRLDRPLRFAESRRWEGLFDDLAAASSPEEALEALLDRASAGVPGALPTPVTQLLRARKTVLRPAPVAARRGTPVRASRATPARSTVLPSPMLAGPEELLRLAHRLQSLVHLVSVERRVSEARRITRLAEDSPGARAEGAEAAEKQELPAGNDQDIEALEKAILERVREQQASVRERSAGGGSGW